MTGCIYCMTYQSRKVWFGAASSESRYNPRKTIIVCPTSVQTGTTTATTTLDLRGDAHFSSFFRALDAQFVLTAPNSSCLRPPADNDDDR
jgi:hypothetical protein